MNSNMMVEIHVSSFSLRILALFGLLTYFFKHLRKILNLQSSFTIKHEPTQWVKSPKKQSELTRTHSFRLLLAILPTGKVEENKNRQCMNEYIATFTHNVLHHSELICCIFSTLAVLSGQDDYRGRFYKIIGFKQVKRSDMDKTFKSKWL